MAYTLADKAFDGPLERFFDTVRQAEEHNLKYAAWSLESTTGDWFSAFFFAFGKCRLSEEFLSMWEYMNRKYLDPKYDNLGSEQVSERHELHIIRKTAESLKCLLSICDGTSSSRRWEGDYIPAKFWMLACLTREPELVRQVLAKTSPSKRHTVGPMINCLRRELNALKRKPFTEFNIRTLVDKFYSKAVQIYSGVDLLDGVYGVYSVMSTPSLPSSSTIDGGSTGSDIWSTNSTTTLSSSSPSPSPLSPYYPYGSRMSTATTVVDGSTTLSPAETPRNSHTASAATTPFSARSFGSPGRSFQGEGGGGGRGGRRGPSSPFIGRYEPAYVSKFLSGLSTTTTEQQTFGDITMEPEDGSIVCDIDGNNDNNNNNNNNNNNDNATTKAEPKEKQAPQSARGGYFTLPDFYDMKNSSARTQSQFVRRAVVPDLALVSVLVSYYLHHVHGVSLPKGLAYEDIPAIKGPYHEK